MPINQTPIINLTTNGAPVQINVECHQGPGGSQLDTSSTLAVNASPAPGIATIATHPTNSRAVVVTPGGSAGTLSLFVSSTPGADKNLEVRLQVDPPPLLREIVYLGHGPVQ